MKWKIEKGYVHPISSDKNIDPEKHKEYITKGVQDYYQTVHNNTPDIELTAIYKNGTFEKFHINITHKKH